jgi:peptide/nickel transport system permease protein
MTMGRLGRFALRRTAQAVPVVTGIVTLTFFLIHLAPGDPVYMMAGEGGDAAYYQEMRGRYGLDRPIMEQYVRYLGAVVRGDLGHSYAYQRPALSVILERLPATLLLTGAALVLAVAAGLALGVLTAIAPASRFDVGVRVATSAIFAAPVFWIGQLLLLLFAVIVPVFPVGGLSSLRGGNGGGAGDVIWHLALPALCLSFGFLAALGRVVRSSLSVETRREYVRAARARGDSRLRAALGHALPNALLPAISLVGHQAGYLLTGAGLAEVVFGWPGVGRLLLDASSGRDYPLVIAVLLAVSVIVVAANVVTDTLYVVADPRLES